MLQRPVAPALAAREEALQSLQIQEPGPTRSVEAALLPPPLVALAEEPKQTRLVPARPQERVREFHG